MGSFLSTLQYTYGAIHAGIKNLSTQNKQYQAILHRINSTPPLPSPSSTSSYWLQDPPFPHLCDRQDGLSENAEKADIVIIGSGIAAASAARTLLSLRPDLQIVVLEARQLCSGATGRNGGHVKTVPYAVFDSLRKSLGGDGLAAERVTRFQMAHLDALLEIDKELGGVGEVREVQTVDLFLEEREFEQAKKQCHSWKERDGGWDGKAWGGEEMRNEFGVNNLVVGAISYKAGALWPYRLVTGIWDSLLKAHPNNLKLCTNTPVESVSHTQADVHPYRVHHTRGIIHACKVLHATNAFAPRLVPSLSPCLTGALAHMTSQRPSPLFAGRDGKRSWSIMYLPGFDYMTQRADSGGRPGDLLVGGGFLRSKENGLDQIGVWDDARMDAFPRMHLGGCVDAIFSEHKTEGAGVGHVGGGVEMAWTGILGFTGDEMPLVGRLPANITERGSDETSQTEGEWIAAGFNGEGMVWAWLCGTATAVMMLGMETEDLEKGVGRPGGKLQDWFPVEETRVDFPRLKRADLRNMTTSGES